MIAHTVVQVQEQSDGLVVAHVERLAGRRMCCGECGRAASRVTATRRLARRWQDLAQREHPLWLVCAPHCVWCPTCGLRVERAGPLHREVAAGHPELVAHCFLEPFASREKIAMDFRFGAVG